MLCPFCAESVPSISVHPVDQTLEYYGSKATLSITATTTATDSHLTYEWYKDGIAVTPELFPYCRRYDTPTLEISPFMPEYEGRYKCSVSNKFGCVDSNEAKLGRCYLQV